MGAKGRGRTWTGKKAGRLALLGEGVGDVWAARERREGSPGRSLYADNRGRVTCLFRTQFPSQSGRFSPVFSAFQAQELSAI